MVTAIEILLLLVLSCLNVYNRKFTHPRGSDKIVSSSVKHFILLAEKIDQLDGDKVARMREKSRPVYKTFLVHRKNSSCIFQYHKRDNSPLSSSVLLAFNLSIFERFVQVGSFPYEMIEVK